MPDSLPPTPAQLTTGTGPSLPWAEIAAAAGAATAYVSAPAGLLGGMPAGWHTDPCGQHDCVVVVDPTGVTDLDGPSRLAGEQPVVAVSANLGAPSRALALLTGDERPVVGQGRLTPTELDAAMASLGRTPVRPPPEQTVPTGRPLEDLLAAVAAGAGGHDRHWLVRRYDVGVPTPQDSPEPALSVLVRTQGRRPDAIADVLLCLSAQTTDDFEVLLLAHDLSAPQRDVLESQVASLPDGLRPRVRVVPVSGGGRSRPLNLGVESARGRYVAVLDDDDLVFAHWAETFASGAITAPGQIVRAIAVEQDVERSDDWLTHRSASWPRARWDARFSFLAHVVDNHSPIHSYAYPRETFDRLRLRFDDALPVLEDWDLLVRAAALLGVHDTEVVTALYRRWPREKSSFSELAEEGWTEVAWEIVGGWDRQPLLLPAGSATALRRDGIRLIACRPLRARVGSRLGRLKDRIVPSVSRTPLHPLLRFIYRRLIRILDDRS